nr:hypothetical protein [Tanacetum cinerariifolium]
AQSWKNDLARQTDPRSSFNELLDTPIDFSNFIMHRLNRSDEQQNLYKALVEAYDADKAILDTYGKSTILKRRREDDDQEGPSAGSDRGSKRQKEGEEPVQTTCQMEEPPHLMFETGVDDQPIVQTSQHPEWFSQPRRPPLPDRDWNKTLPAAQGDAQSWVSDLARQTDARSSFNELLDTPIDFSNFIMNRFNVDTLTPELLARPTYELMRGSCNSLTELEYHLEDVYKATTDQLDWVNHEGQQYPHNLLQPLPLIPDNRGQQYPHNLLQPLPLIPDNRGRRVIPFEHFINNDLEYLRGGASSHKYTTSVTKMKATDYGHIKWIEDLFYRYAVNQESALDVYSKRRIIAITEIKIVEWHDHKHLDWISVRRDDDQIYKFKEDDFKRLRLQDIEDMLLLLVQGKLSNLTVEEHLAFNVSLRMFTRSIIIKRRVEDLQLGVESYQKKLNLTKPDTYCPNLKRREAYTAHSNPRGFIYQNKDKKNRLMRIDGLHKFSDGTFNDVRNALDDRLKGIRMQYLPTTIWKRGDKDRAAAMIQAIEKMLKTRRIMRSLEKFVGGRLVLVNKSHNKTSYELFNGRSPAIGILKPFGCHVMILNTLDYLGKFEEKGDEGYFIGYSISSKAFRVFNKRTRRVEENLHVEFLENKAIEKGDGPNWLFDIDSITKSMYCVSVDVGIISTNLSGTKDAGNQEAKKDVSSLRYIALPNWTHDALLEFSSSKPQDHCSTKVPEGSGNHNPTASTSNPPADPMETLIVETPIPTASSPVPNAYSSDSQEPSSDARLISKRVANQEETPSLDNILSLTNRFEDILGVTTNSDESNRVEPDISNKETAITASPTHTLIIHKDHPKSQIISPLDTLIQTRNKSKEIFDALQDPSWVEAMQEKHLQFKIQNVWTLVDYPKGMDVKSAFLCGTINEEVRQRGDFILVQVYVNDITFGSSNPQLCKEFKALMHEKFQISVMGEPNFFLGLQVLEKEDGIFLSQEKYVGDILKKFGYSEVRSLNTPMDKENPWGKDGTGKEVNLHLYRSMIGSLMYLTAYRPDIMFTVCACARHQVTPKECHLHAVKRIFIYLKGHPKLGLWYPKESPFDLVAYLDSDYGGATQDRKSTTRGCEFFGRRLISWQRKKQTIVATSTTECKLFQLLGKLSTVSVFLGFGLTFVGTSKSWGVLRILTISLRLIPLIVIKGLMNSSMSILLFQVCMYGYGSNTIMVRLQFCDYHNMVAILEKREHDIDFHPMVDFIEASPRRIKTTEEGTQILATVHGIYRTVTESSLRRNLKIKDKEGINEPASPLRDVSQGEACPTDSSFIADLDRATIDKSSTLPHDSAPRVTSPAAEVEINKLKERVKLLEDREGVAATRSRDDAPIKGRSIDEGEAAAERIIPTASPVFATATVVTPYKRRKGKEVMVESETPKKQKIQEQIDTKVARELEEQLERERIIEEVEAKFNSVWKQMEDFIPMGLKEEAERIKRKGLSLEQESAKKQKTSEEMANDLVLKIYKITNSPRQQVMSDASFAVTYTSIYTDSEPCRCYGEDSVETGPPRVIADYPADGGDGDYEPSDNDDDDDTDDEDPKEEPFEDEEDD